MSLTLTDDEWIEYFRLQDLANSYNKKAKDYLDHLIRNKRADEYTRKNTEETNNNHQVFIMPGGRKQ